MEESKKIKDMTDEEFAKWHKEQEIKALLKNSGLDGYEENMKLNLIDEDGNRIDESGNRLDEKGKLID